MKTYRHILLAFDLRGNGREMAAHAADLARRYDALLTILYVQEHFPEDLPVECIPPEDKDPETFLLKRARREIETILATLEYKRIELKLQLSSASAKAEIVEYARTNQVDLIVLGAHAHRGLSSLLGSTASGVVMAAPCDVLALRL